jgi:hypothetical protein
LSVITPSPAHIFSSLRVAQASKRQTSVPAQTDVHFLIKH